MLKSLRESIKNLIDNNSGNVMNEYIKENDKEIVNEQRKQQIYDEFLKENSTNDDFSSFLKQEEGNIEEFIAEKINKGEKVNNKEEQETQVEQETQEEIISKDNHSEELKETYRYAMNEYYALLSRANISNYNTTSREISKDTFAKMVYYQKIMSKCDMEFKSINKQHIIDSDLGISKEENALMYQSLIQERHIDKKFDKAIEHIEYLNNQLEFKQEEIEQFIQSMKGEKFTPAKLNTFNLLKEEYLSIKGEIDNLQPSMEHIYEQQELAERQEFVIDKSAGNGYLKSKYKRLDSNVKLFSEKMEENDETLAEEIEEEVSEFYDIQKDLLEIYRREQEKAILKKDYELATKYNDMQQDLIDTIKEYSTELAKENDINITKEEEKIDKAEDLIESKEKEEEEKEKEKIDITSDNNLKVEENNLFEKENIDLNEKTEEFKEIYKPNKLKKQLFNLMFSKKNIEKYKELEGFEYPQDASDLQKEIDEILEKLEAEGIENFEDIDEKTKQDLLEKFKNMTDIENEYIEEKGFKLNAEKEESKIDKQIDLVNNEESKLVEEDTNVRTEDLETKTITNQEVSFNEKNKENEKVIYKKEDNGFSPASAIEDTEGKSVRKEVIKTTNIDRETDVSKTTKDMSNFEKELFGGVKQEEEISKNKPAKVESFELNFDNNKDLEVDNQISSEVNDFKNSLTEMVYNEEEQKVNYEEYDKKEKAKEKIKIKNVERGE